jgi:succinate dehydrogenase / fumarate reductase cytochrome b subunit
MAPQQRVLGSSIGTKFVMGATGALLVLFVIGHMLGNLQIFLGPDALNHYAELLRTLPEALWVVRLMLLVAVVLHIVTAIQLTLQNRAARPERYVRTRPVQVGIAARTLILSGSLIGAFVVYHLLHFTFLVTHPEYALLHDARGRHDVYTMVILGFSQWPITLFYVAAQILLALHLSHGTASVFQTLGLGGERWRPFVERAGAVVAWIVLIGNVSIPTAVMLGLLRAPGGS